MNVKKYNLYFHKHISKFVFFYKLSHAYKKIKFATQF